MKKSVIFCLCVVVIALFAACNKDQEGVYNPSKKIQKIYSIDDGVKELEEVWAWESDMLVTITRYDDYDGTPYTTRFSYDNNHRLTAMVEGLARTEFIYDKKYLKKIVSYSIENNTQLGSIEFEHKNGKISEMRIDFSIFDDWGDDWNDWKKIGVLNSLRFMMPEAYPFVVTAMKKCSKEAKGEQYTMKLNWNGDNVKSMELTYSFSGMMVTQTAEMTYDNKNNPMYGLFASMTSNGASNLFLNKNNPLSVKNLFAGHVMESSDYTYEYEENFPTKVTCKKVDDDGNIDIDTIIYEY